MTSSCSLACGRVASLLGTREGRADYCSLLVDHLGIQSASTSPGMIDEPVTPCGKVSDRGSRNVVRTRAVARSLQILVSRPKAPPARGTGRHAGRGFRGRSDEVMCQDELAGRSVASHRSRAPAIRAELVTVVPIASGAEIHR